MSLRQSFNRLIDAIAIPNLSLYLVMGQVAVFGMMAFRGDQVLAPIYFSPAQVLEGEVWRVFTFVLMPPTASPIFLIFAWYLFWMFGTALENHWGTSRYNLFLLLGWAFTVIAAFVSPGSPYPVSNAFLAGSVFLAFAFLVPDFELLLFFILPVKVKWLALIQWCGYALAFVSGPAVVRLTVLASVGNFLVFFGRDLWNLVRQKKRQRVHQAHQAAARAADAEPRFRCVVCGQDSQAHPDWDFRYCSQCTGDQCYCPEHIRNHEHVVADVSSEP